MNSRPAIDTNVLVFASSANDLQKRQRAVYLITQSFVTCTQVVSEYINVMQRLFKIPKAQVLKNSIQLFSAASIIPVQLSTLRLALELVTRSQFQTFDAIIIASALEANCSILYSEDMQHKQLIEGRLRIVNPFL